MQMEAWLESNDGDSLMAGFKLPKLSFWGDFADFELTTLVKAKQPPYSLSSLTPSFPFTLLLISRSEP